MRHASRWMSLYETEREIRQTEEHLLLLQKRLGEQTVEQQGQSHPPPDPEDLIQGYPWPSSRITRADMIRLTELRRLLRKPITTLLHDAVTALYAVVAPKTNLKVVPWRDEGSSVWYVVDADAPTDDQPNVIATASTRHDAEAILRTLKSAERSSPASP